MSSKLHELDHLKLALAEQLQELYPNSDAPSWCIERALLIHEETMEQAHMLALVTRDGYRSGFWNVPAFAQVMLVDPSGELMRIIPGRAEEKLLLIQYMETVAAHTTVAEWFSVVFAALREVRFEQRYFEDFFVMSQANL